MDLKGRDFLKLLDYTPEEINSLLDLAADLKEKKKKDWRRHGRLLLSRQSVPYK